MRGTRAKDIRKYVAIKFPYLSKEVLYAQKPNGTIITHAGCQRHVYTRIKNNYKKKQRGEY